MEWPKLKVHPKLDEIIIPGIDDDLVVAVVPYQGMAAPYDVCAIRRLFAAAPEMYAMLQEREQKCTHRDCCGTPGKVCDRCKQWSRLKATIDGEK